MDHVSFFKHLFESIPDYRKIVILLFLFKNDIDFLQECGFLRYDINRLCLELKTILIEAN